MIGFYLAISDKISHCSELYDISSTLSDLPALRCFEKYLDVELYKILGALRTVNFLLNIQSIVFA